MSYVFIALTLFLAHTNLRAETQESASLESIFSQTKAGDLLIIDLDNTLLRPAQMLGSPEWVAHRRKEYEDTMTSRGIILPTARREAASRILETWEKTQHKTTAQALEPKANTLLSQLILQENNVLLISTRPVSMIDITIAQLSSVGITFTKKPAFLKPTSPAKIQVLSDRTSYWQNGVLFIGPLNSARDVIQRFIKEHVQKTPNRIVTVDDEFDLVTSMQPTTDDHYAGWRFTGADIYKKSFEPAVAGVQEKYLDKELLSDAEARELIKKNHGNLP